MAYTKNFRPTYPNGWKDLPSKDTPVLASTLTGYDAAITEIEEELVKNDAALEQLQQNKASVDSPVFVGSPKTPTASVGTNNTQIATTAFAQNVVSVHNTSDTAHDDIRNLISGLTTRLNALADSDDTTLDQLSEIVAYIKSNRTLIESITTNKVSVTDIVDNLTSTATNKPLSAKQGKVLKDLIDSQTADGGDADTVDGKHASDLQDYNNLTNKPDIPPGDIYGTHAISLGRTGTVGYGSIAFGRENEAINESGIALGVKNKVQGFCAMAEGQGNIISSQDAVALGNYNKVNNGGRAAIGNSCEASARNAIAIGKNSHTYGENSIVIGNDSAESNYPNQIILGKYNDNKLNNLLEIGNGYESNGTTYRSNALELDVDGNLTVAGQITDGKGVVLRDMQWKCVNPTGTVGAGWIDLPDIDSGEIWVITTSEADATGYRAMQQTSFPAGFASLNMAVVEGSYLNAAWGVYTEWITLEKRIHLNTFRRTFNSTTVDLKSTATTWVYYR